MKQMRKTRYDYLKRQGFLHAEALELSRTSRGGMNAPYFQQMIRSRRAVLQNAKRNNWTQDEYYNHIRKQYSKSGFVKPDKLGRYRPDVWSLLRRYQEARYGKGDEYQSPWKKRTVSPRTGRTAKKPTKKFDKSSMYRSWIKQLTDKIDRLPDNNRRRQLEKQRDNLRRLLEQNGK